MRQKWTGWERKQEAAGKVWQMWALGVSQLCAFCLTHPPVGIFRGVLLETLNAGVKHPSMPSFREIFSLPLEPYSLLWGQQTSVENFFLGRIQDSAPWTPSGDKVACISLRRTELCPHLLFICVVPNPAAQNVTIFWVKVTLVIISIKLIQ